MIPAHHSLVNHMVLANHWLSVWSFGENLHELSQDSSSLIHAIESTSDQCQVNICDKRGNCLGYAIVIPYGVMDNETVADYTDNDLLNNWFDEYQGSVTGSHWD